jgi:hypothetical protein
VVLATGGGGATYDDQTRIVHTKVRPVLKTADFLAAAPVAFIGLRLLDGNYAGPLIRVRRVNMGATLDIYPTSTGALDAAAIATHCGSAVGTIAVIYDQSGAGRTATTAGDDAGVPHLVRYGDYHDRQLWQALRLHRR